MKRVLPLLVITLFLAGIFIVPSTGITSQARLQENTITSTESIIDSKMLQSGLPDDPVFRVALYDESNNSVPSYAHGAMNTNNSIIYPLLTDAGFDVTNVTFQDILDYELTTANFDVLVLADNCPRENITNLVKDFWLAGGGVLSIDSAISYLGYAGILYRENESIADGYLDFWTYFYNGNASIVGGHPVTQSYDDGDLVNYHYADWAMIDKSDFATTSVWSRTTILAEDSDNSDNLIAVAVDALDRGGKVVQMGIPIYYPWWTSGFEDMIIDAIGWLAPKPKAKIAYDFSHQPRLSVDMWDTFSTIWNPTNSFGDLRDTYVVRDYTVDKFMPSASGNFTAARLNQYDIMILDWPDLNYTAAERTTFMTWLDAGGGLIVLGDRAGLGGDGYLYTNFLLDDLDMYLAENNTLDFVDAYVASPQHPTTEGCDTLAISYRNYINFSGPAAQEVWKYDNNVIVSAQEYGNGRVVMFGDMNILDNGPLQTIGKDNKLFAINIANWLSADNAGILVYSDDPYDGGPYTSSPAQVLNQLGIPFYMTFTDFGFNASVNGTWFAQDWELVILDHNNYFYTSMYDGMLDYFMNGGRGIVNTFRIDDFPTHPLWNYMGANFSENWDSNQPAYIWDSSNDIFNSPIFYNASTMEVIGASYGDDGDKVTVLENATALAGFTATPEVGNASIVLSNDGNMLLDSFLLNNMRGDYDESGYRDTFELWFNQIVMMWYLPTIDHPGDRTIESGTTGNTITWNPDHAAPSTYEVLVDDAVEDSGSWDGSAISFSADGLSLGVHVVQVRAFGDYDVPRTDTVIVTVVDTLAPLLNSPADITMAQNSTGNTLTWVASDPNPDQFVLLVNSTVVDSGVWSGSSVEVDLDDLAEGVYFFTIRVNDTVGHMSEDTVLVTVTPPSAFGLPEWLDTTTLLLIVIGVLALIIIILALRRRK
ncbi:MAG: hypothetical protein ACFFF4_09180 [Candidatus Thorarchaeota archaeon]